MSEPFIGQIIMFGGNFAPRGWALCDGQLLPISQNTALFSLLGTAYGGDGRSTFGLPDLRGRVPMHAGTGGGLTERRLGQKIGSEATTLASDNLPPLVIRCSSGAGSKTDPTGNYPAHAGRDRIYSSTADAAMALDMVQGTGAATPVPINNVQPSQVIHFIIALQGIFPSRS